MTNVVNFRERVAAVNCLNMGYDTMHQVVALCRKFIAVAEHLFGLLFKWVESLDFGKCLSQELGLTRIRPRKVFIDGATSKVSMCGKNNAVEALLEQCPVDLDEPNCSAQRLKFGGVIHETSNAEFSGERSKSAGT